MDTLMLDRTQGLTLTALTLVAVGTLIYIGWKEGVTSEPMAAWVQAVGTIAAILSVTLPVLIDRRLQRRQAKAMTLAAAESAFDTMSATARRYTDPNYVGSEWWVPQWEIITLNLANAPIHDTGSPEAFKAFAALHEYAARAQIWDEPPNSKQRKSGQTLDGFVISLMSNASREMETLRRELSR